MTLISFVRRKRLFDHENVAKYIKKLKPKIQALFLIVFEENNTKVSLIQLYPECIKFKAISVYFVNNNSKGLY